MLLLRSSLLSDSIRLFTFRLLGFFSYFLVCLLDMDVGSLEDLNYTS